MQPPLEEDSGGGFFSVTAKSPPVRACFRHLPDRENISCFRDILLNIATCCAIIIMNFNVYISAGEERMTYSYNRLWKLLIDKGMTKTQMRKAAGISTNILAKMGKDEPVSMESLAKICVALECSLDDIVEIQKDGAE